MIGFSKSTSYFSECFQAVKNPDGSLTDWIYTGIGILFFSLFINYIDILMCFCKWLLYADDPHIYLACHANELNRYVLKFDADIA